MPAAQDCNLFNWLKTLYPIWARMGPEDIRISTQTALAELALSGCTTASDHLYLFPNGSRLDDEILAAREMGLRLHASRGSMSLGESKGGLPPDSVVEDEAAILKDSQRLIETYHDPNPGAMTQIVLAPCSPFSVTGNLMRQSASLAREYGVNLHTHLAETQDEESFCLQKFGYKPVAYMDLLNWTGPDVWFAHSVHVNSEEMRLYAQTGCGVAHCPTSNMRLASGIAPIMEMAEMGCEGRPGRGWLRQQRWLQYAGRSAPGHAAGPPERRAARRFALRRRRPRLDDCPPGAGAGDTRRRGRAGSHRPRLAGAG